MLKIMGSVVLVLLGSATTALATATNGPPSVPEPSMLVMLASGIGGGILYARNRRAK